MNIDIEYLGGPEVKALNLTDSEIIDAVERGLDAAGRGQTVIEPRTHLRPDAGTEGHFNILRGYIEPLDLAGVKIVGDFVDNYKNGLPSEMALLNLFCPKTGAPRAVIDAAGIGTSVRAAQRTGTCDCSTACSTLKRFAFTADALKAEMLSQKGSAMI